MASQREEVSFWPQLKAWLQRFPHGPPSGEVTPVLKCLICLEDNEILTPATPPANIADAQAGVTLFCGHMMHKECYENWAKHLTDKGKTVTCPSCRQDLVHTKDQVSFDGCTHAAYAYALPVNYYFPCNIPLTKPEGGSIPNFCHPCRVDSMNYVARQISELRQDGYDDFQIRNVLFHSAAGALELTDFEKQAAFPPNPNGTPRAPWVAPPPNNEQNYLFEQLREQVIREGDTWRGPAPRPPPVGFFGLQ